MLWFTSLTNGPAKLILAVWPQVEGEACNTSVSLRAGYPDSVHHGSSKQGYGDRIHLSHGVVQGGYIVEIESPIRQPELIRLFTKCALVPPRQDRGHEPAEIHSPFRERRP